MNIGVHILFQISVLGFFAVYPEVAPLGRQTVSFLIFWGPSILFSIVVAPICIPMLSAWRFPFLHILTNTCVLIYWWYPLWQVDLVILIYIFLMISDIERIFICLLAICVFSLEKNLFRTSAPFLNWIVYLFLVLSCVFGCWPLITCIIGEYLPQFNKVSFCFVDVFLCCAKTF